MANNDTNILATLKDYERRLRILEQNVQITNLTLPAGGKIVVPVMTADPLSPTNGQIWYNSTSGTFKIRQGGESLPFENTYIAPSFLNSWVDYDATYNIAGYCRDIFGFVHLRGLVKNGTIGAAIFTLPAGYRPSRRQLFTTSSNGALGRCDVDTSGNVIANVGNNAWFSLDGLTFLAEA